MKKLPQHIQNSFVGTNYQLKKNSHLNYVEHSLNFLAEFDIHFACKYHIQCLNVFILSVNERFKTLSMGSFTLI